MTAVSDSMIRRATPDEAPFLNALTGRSVLYWGYEPEFLDWEPEAITVTADFIAHSPVYVLMEDDRVVGYYGLAGEPPEMVLDKLFVEADRIGTGAGKRLWRHAVATARGLGAKVLTFASDPNAAPFYRAMGAQWVSAEPTSRPGWVLQMFRYPISDATPAPIQAQTEGAP
ncbi:MAG: GNAT family N-acetyltransferase [Chloroflexota bacterium]|nr:GNAT family N-acetyltransferase [Chloroflexota bacterium]